MMTEKQRQGRESKLRLWHKQNKTQQWIAEQLGITRQRVQQLEKELQLVRSIGRTPKLYKLKCHQTGEIFYAKKPDQKYKDRDAFLAARRNQLSPKERAKRDSIRREKNRQKAYNYYHNVFKNRPDWKKIVRARNKKQYASQSAN